MTNMIERVAQAMCVRALGGRQCPCVQSGQFNCRDTFPWDQAKAALEVMREPTEEMVMAGEQPYATKNKYSAMIDAALKNTSD